MNERLQGKLSEVVGANNISYILNDTKDFSVTGYKVMQNHSGSGLLRCAKIMYNGQIKLVYIVGDNKPLSHVATRLGVNELNAVVFNLIQRAMEIKSNGFFRAENLELDFNKIFIDTSDYSVHLVYFPLAGGMTGKISAFENEFRIALINLFNSFPVFNAPQFQRLCSDLANGSLPLDVILKKLQDNINGNNFNQKIYEPGGATDYTDPRVNPNSSGYEKYDGYYKHITPGNDSHNTGYQKYDIVNHDIYGNGYQDDIYPGYEKLGTGNQGAGQGYQKHDFAKQGIYGNGYQDDVYVPGYEKKDIVSQGAGQGYQKHDFVNQGGYKPDTKNGSYPAQPNMSQPTLTVTAINTPVQVILTVDQPEYLIGKNPNMVNGAVTHNPAISRVHCKISYTSGKYYLTDMDSANGTYVNQQKLEKQQTVEIFNGDFLKLANSDFIISF